MKRSKKIVLTGLLFFLLTIVYRFFMCVLFQKALSEYNYIQNGLLVVLLYYLAVMVFSALYAKYKRVHDYMFRFFINGELFAMVISYFIVMITLSFLLIKNDDVVIAWISFLVAIIHGLELCEQE